MNGCLTFDSELVKDKIVLVDTAGICDNLVLTVTRAAASGAIGVIFYHHSEGLVGIPLGNYDAPSIRGVMIERQHGENIRSALSRGETVNIQLVKGLLIADDAYEEQFIFRADEISATRAVNFLWHTHPER